MMGIMIHDEAVIEGLTRLAKRDGVTRAEALKRALQAMCEPGELAEPKLFPRERVETKTWRIGARPKSVRR